MLLGAAPHQARANLAVSGFIWQRVVKPAQRKWHFFQDVLAGELSFSAVQQLIRDLMCYILNLAQCLIDDGLHAASQITGADCWSLLHLIFYFLGDRSCLFAGANDSQETEIARTAPSASRGYTEAQVLALSLL